MRGARNSSHSIFPAQSGRNGRARAMAGTIKINGTVFSILQELRLANGSHLLSFTLGNYSAAADLTTTIVKILNSC